MVDFYSNKETNWWVLKSFSLTSRIFIYVHSHYISIYFPWSCTASSHIISHPQSGRAAVWVSMVWQCQGLSLQLQYWCCRTWARCWGLGRGGALGEGSFSLKLRACTWNVMVGRRSWSLYFPFGRFALFSGALAVSFRECYVLVQVFLPIFLMSVETFLPLHFFWGCVGFQWIGLGGVPFLVVAGGAWVCKLF